MGIKRMKDLPTVPIEEPPTLVFMSPEQYEVAYEEKFGVAPPEELEVQSEGVPRFIRNAAGDIIDTASDPVD